MPIYEIDAVDNAGEQQKHRLDGETESAVAASLRSDGWTIIELRAVVSNETPVATPLLVALARIRDSDIALLFRQLSSLIRSGVRIVSALELLAKQSENRKLRHILDSMRRSIESGRQLSEALSDYPRQFGPSATGIIRAGEQSGLLEEALERLANELEERIEFRRHIATAFIYPAIVVLAAIGVTGFLIGFVIPRITPFLMARGGRLPPQTQWVIDAGAFVTTYWRQLIGALIGAPVIAMAANRTELGKRVIDRTLLAVPVIGRILQLKSVLEFSRSVASMLSSGLPLPETLATACGTVSNTAYQSEINRMRNAILAGGALSDQLLSASRLFPPLVGETVRVGEETGGLDDAMRLVSEIYWKMLQMRIKRMNALIEPSLTLLLAGIVGFIGWAMISGMLSMY